MNKKYFVKFFNSEGPINIGDWFRYLKYPPLKRSRKNPLAEYPYPQYQKVKPFLISKDIKVGDRFNSANGKNFICSEIDLKKVYSIGGLSSDIERVPHNKKYCYKIIGEISPNVSFINENDEFEESEIRKKFICEAPDPDEYCFKCSSTSTCKSEEFIYLIKDEYDVFH